MKITYLGPQTSDGKPIHLTNRFPGEVTLYLAGAGDDISGGVRGAGPQQELSRNSAGDSEHVTQFLDWVYLGGGHATYSNGASGCWISLHLRMPATTLASNPGAGSVNLYPTGLGFNIVVPAAGDGSHDLGSTVVPVPNEDGTGWWDWEGSPTGPGAVTPNSTQKGGFDLFDAGLDPVRFVNRVPLMSGGVGNRLDLDVEEIKPKKILPQWQLITTLHHAGGVNELHASWLLVTARIKTV